MNFLMPRSFGAKIFTFTILIVFLVVGFITAKNSLFLRDNLNRQYQSSLIDATQLLGERTFSLFTRWDNQLSYFVQAIYQAQPSDRTIMIKSFLESEEGLAGLAILQSRGDQNVEIGSHFNDKSQDFDHNTLVKSLGQKEVTVMRHPNAQNLAFLVRRISIRGSKNPILAILLFELRVLPIDRAQNKDSETFLLDEDFVDVLSGIPYQKAVSQVGFVAKAKKVMSGDIGSGYLGELKQGKIDMFVAYHHLPSYPLILVVHQNTSAIGRAIREFFVEMLRWTVFFVLLAIFIASAIIRSLVGDLKELSAATQSIGSGRFDKVVAVRSKDEVGQLSASFNLMTRKIVGLLGAEHEKARLDQELSMAQTVQNTFFRESLIKSTNFTLASFYQPATECGGDWWGHFPLSEGKELIVIGDATGHGVPAALVTAIAYASTNILAEQIRAGMFPDDEPSSILGSLSNLLNRTLDGKICMSFIAMVVDTKGRRLTFSNGGHPFPILVPKDPHDVRLGEGKKKVPFRFLMQKKKSENMLGTEPRSLFYNENVDLVPGDKIIVFTDGLTEALNAEGRQWGSKGMKNVLKDHGNSKVNILRDLIISDAVKFNFKANQFDDDVTLVVLEYAETGMKAS